MWKNVNVYSDRCTVGSISKSSSMSCRGVYMQLHMDFSGDQDTVVAFSEYGLMVLSTEFGKFCLTDVV